LYGSPAVPRAVPWKVDPLRLRSPRCLEDDMEEQRVAMAGDEADLEGELADQPGVDANLGDAKRPGETASSTRWTISDSEDDAGMAVTSDGGCTW
jgi:hypothetical protein